MAAYPTVKRCKHVRIDNKPIQQIGGPPIPHQTAKCAIKLQSGQHRLLVYDTLFKLGLEGSILSTTRASL